MNLKKGFLLFATFALVVLFQNCGEFRVIEPQSLAVNSSVADLALEAALNEVVKAEPFSVSANLNKFQFDPSFQFEWSHTLEDQVGVCQQVVSADSARVTITCPDGGVVTVTFMARDRYGNTYEDQIRFLVNFERRDVQTGGELPPVSEMPSVNQ